MNPYIDEEADEREEMDEIQEREDDEEEEQVEEGTDDDLPDTKEVKVDGKFNLSAKQVFLTYPQAEGLTKKKILDHVKGKFKVAISKYVIGEETHRDGGIHFHCYFKWEKKIRVRDARGFDVEGKHPNIKTCKKNPTGVIEYCMKDGNWEGDGCSLFPNSKGFVKKKQDFDAWVTYRKNQFKPVAWPVKLLNGRVVERPIQSMRAKKLRHFWIWGRANIGKTTWANKQFANQQVF